MANSASGPAMPASASTKRTASPGSGRPVTRHSEAGEDADDQRIDEDLARRNRATSASGGSRLPALAPEQLEQDDRGHHHGRQMDRDDQRQDVDAVLPEHAEHERNAEQHQCWRRPPRRRRPRRPALSRPKIRVVTRLSGGPGDDDRREIGRPQPPRRRAVEIGARPWCGTEAAAWRRRRRIRESASPVSRLQIAGPARRNSRARRARRRTARFR